jgi:hypothetical protein
MRGHRHRTRSVSSPIERFSRNMRMYTPACTGHTLCVAITICANTVLTIKEGTVTPVLTSHPATCIFLTITLFAGLTPSMVIAAEQGREGPHSLIHRPQAARPALRTPSRETGVRPLNDQPPRLTSRAELPTASAPPASAPVKHHRKLATRPSTVSAAIAVQETSLAAAVQVTRTTSDSSKATAPSATAPITQSTASHFTRATSTAAATTTPKSFTPSPLANAATAGSMASTGGGSTSSLSGSRSAVNLLRTSAIASLLQAPTPVVAAPASSTPPPTPPSTPSPGPSTGNVTLSWVANTEPDLAGYTVYVGTASGQYDFPGSPFMPGLVTSYTVSNLPKPQTYFFALSAYDNAGNESLLSAEISSSLY